MKPEDVRPGVSVRVLRNDCGANVPDDYSYYDGMIPRLKSGDTFGLGREVYVQGKYLYYIADLATGWLNVIPLEDLEVIGNRCSCPITVLLNEGCKCGGN